MKILPCNFLYFAQKQTRAASINSIKKFSTKALKLL